MADKKEVEKKTGRKQEPADASGEKKSSARPSLGYTQWLIVAGVVILCGAAGFGFERLLIRPTVADRTNDGQQEQTMQAEQAHSPAEDAGKSWYHDLEPVVANLNEPGVTRYVRVTLTLEISNEMDQKKGQAFLKEKNPILKNWLTIYLASQTINNIRGDRNLRRIQSEILDTFNEKLFPDAKPKIKRVLFKEFAIQ
jgi:flagellar basal body-associated protein FliL